MSEIQKNSKRAGLMFILLLGVAMFSVFILPKINLLPKMVTNDVKQAQTITTPKSNAQVKASTSSGGGLCVEGDVCDYIHEIAYQPVCSIGDASTDMVPGSSVHGSVSVTQNAHVEIFLLTIPQVLLQGSKYVDDSKKIISYDYPVYRDSQHVILDDEARAVCAPGVTCDEFDQASKIPDTPFAVHAFTEVKNADGGGTGGDGKAVIASDPKLNSVCPTVQKAKADPKLSGRYSERLDLQFQPPGPHTTNRNFDAVECYRSNPDGETLVEAKNFISCLTDVKPTDFIMNAFYTLQHWTDCLADEAQCDSYTIVAIRLDALFGGVFKCSSPDCEIRFFDYQKLKSTAPGDAVTMIPDYINPEQVDYLRSVTEPYYIMTPCKIRIDKGGIYDVPCLWDISPYQRQYEIQKSALMPGQTEMPSTFDEYWLGGVFPELKLRSRMCI